MALDYGEKNIGIAISDEEEKFVFPFDIILTSDFCKNPDILKNKIPRFSQITEIIIGHPVNLKNKDTPQTLKTREFFKIISEAYAPIPVKLVDERLTSAQLLKDVQSSGGKPSKIKDKKDMYEAALLLEFYLTRRKNLNEIQSF